jgi:serine protease
LAGKVVGGYDFIANVSTANDGDGRDIDARDPGDWGSCSTTSSWHGTHVAGNIGALAGNGMGSLGVAFNARIVSARVLGVCGGYISDIADAIRWTSGNTVAGVPANLNPARVLNLSLSGPGACPSELATAVNAARSLGSLVIVAAGNNASDAGGYQPGNCPGVLAVAATDATGARAYFSNFGAVVGIAAPGVSIWSTLNSGTTTPGADSYAAYSGTSMATPHVVGVAALVAAVNPNLGGDEIATILKSTAKAFPSNCSGCGSGIVNAKAAVDAAVASRYRLTASPASVSIAGYGGLDFESNVTIKNGSNISVGPISTNLVRTSGTVLGGGLRIVVNGCAGSVLLAGASCTMTLDYMASCGGKATSGSWDLQILSPTTSIPVIVPINGTSRAGICY